jgi:hypothetical protein
MATITPMEPGQIASQAGADKLRGELLSAHEVRCAQLWHAVSTVYADGAAEIEISARYNPATDTWSQHAFFYSFEAATRALRIYEETGELHEEDA